MDNLKEIHSLKHKYFVSNNGEIFNSKRKLKTKIKNNREYVSLITVDGKQKMFAVSRLVATAFCKIPNHLIDIDINELQVHHIDRNSLNNNYTNLKWLSKDEHILLHNDDDKNSIPVFQIYDNKIVGIYRSCLSASKITGIPCQNIYDVVFNKSRKNKKRRLTAGGYKWTNKLEGQYILSLHQN